MGSFQQQILQRIPASVLKMLGGRPHEDLVSSINATLMIFNGELIHVESGSVAQLENIEAETIAHAAKNLVPRRNEDPSFLLLLPPSMFIASTHSLPGISKGNLISALYLQTESILPSYERSLSLAIDVDNGGGDSESVALWLPLEKLTELFLAFNQQSLFLAAVKPRILNFEIMQSAIGLLDSDANEFTFVVFENGLLRVWQQVNKLDFDHEVFVQQWEDLLKKSSAIKIKELTNFQEYLPSLNKDSNSAYSFFPTGALNVFKKVEKGRRVLAGFAAALVLVLISSIPFIQQSIEFRRAAATLEANRIMSADARLDQQTVVNFENEWGPLNDFPEQHIREAMFALQNVLSPERLSSLEISQGLIKIQGTSSDPQAILQRLEQDALFTEVIFSRATNNTRYYIDLRLSPVNFEAYMVRYFPDN